MLRFAKVQALVITRILSEISEALKKRSEEQNMKHDNEQLDCSDAAIALEHTEEYYKAARELSDYIKALPLSQPENDALIELIIAQVHHAGTGAFAQGFRMGMEFQKWDRKKKGASLEDIARTMLQP